MIARRGQPRRVHFPGLGEALRMRRILQGWSQDEMHYQLREMGSSIRRVDITRYEGGRHTPSLESMRAIAGVLNCTIDSILEHADRLEAAYAKEAAKEAACAGG